MNDLDGCCNKLQLYWLTFGSCWTNGFVGWLGVRWNKMMDCRLFAYCKSTEFVEGHGVLPHYSVERIKDHERFSIQWYRYFSPLFASSFQYNSLLPSSIRAEIRHLIIPNESARLSYCLASFQSIQRESLAAQTYTSGAFWIIRNYNMLLHKLSLWDYVFELRQIIYH